MKIDDLVILIKAGYTKADIEQLGISLGVDTPEVPEEQPKPEEVPKPEEAPKPEAAQDNEKLKQLENKLDYVINRFNYMAVKDSQQPDQHSETVDDILAKVINNIDKE